MRLTHELIKKKSEHNDGIMADLEEISLHQLEIEKIEAINDCRKLKILYLQNNIINKLENLYHLKDLEYLNMALNNIKKIEGLRECEFLRKLDLTVNFIGIENLESSVEELKFNHHLKELFLLGNPCVDWPGCQDFVIGSLPSLKRLDGTQITKTMQIQAAQRLPMLTYQLRALVAKKRQEDREKEDSGVEVVDITEVDEEGNELVGHSPELRTQMYREQAAEKAAKEAEKAKDQPPKRSYDEEHKKAIAECEKQEESGRIRQCNTGGYKFTVDENKENLLIDIFLPKNLDSSMVDVHAQPTYVRVVIKSKVLRLKFDCEVRPDSGSAKRSKITGNLLLTLPKVEQGRIITAHRLDTEAGQKQPKRDTSGRTKYFSKADESAAAEGGSKKMALMMQEAQQAVSIRGIAKEAPQDSLAPRLTAMATKTTSDGNDGGDDSDDDDAPSLTPAAGAVQLQKAAEPELHSEDEEEDDDDSDDEEPPPLE